MDLKGTVSNCSKLPELSERLFSIKRVQKWRSWLQRCASFNFATIRSFLLVLTSVNQADECRKYVGLLTCSSQLSPITTRGKFKWYLRRDWMTDLSQCCNLLHRAPALGTCNQGKEMLMPSITKDEKTSRWKNSLPTLTPHPSPAHSYPPFHPPTVNYVATKQPR